MIAARGRENAADKLAVSGKRVSERVRRESRFLSLVFVVRRVCAGAFQERLANGNLLVRAAVAGANWSVLLACQLACQRAVSCLPRRKTKKA